MKARLLLISVFALAAAGAATAPTFYRHSDAGKPINCAAPTAGLFQGFPEDESCLTGVRDKADGDSMRYHGWFMFNGLEHPATVNPGSSRPPSDRPMWLNWCSIGGTKGQGGQPDRVALLCPPGGLPPKGASADSSTNEETFEQTSLDRMLLNLEPPRQLDANFQHVPIPTPNDLSAVSEVLYDPVTSQTLINCFSSGDPVPAHGGALMEYPIEISNTPKKQNCPLTGPSSLDGFDRGAVAIKPIWWVIPAAGAISQPVRVWDIADSTHDRGAVGAWDTDVFLELNDKDECKMLDLADPKYGYLGSHPVLAPLSCFYFQRVRESDLRSAQTAFSDLQLEKSAPAAQPANGRESLLILLGFHVATREIADWTWQTYWWSGRAFTQEPPPQGEGNLHNGSPASLGGTLGPEWAHYVMDTTFGAPTGTSQEAPVAFNPYLEQGFPGGNQSNCLHCHQYAVFRQDPKDAGNGFNQGTRLGLTPPNTTTHFCVGNDTDPYFSNGMKTDCLWSLADANVPGHLHPSIPFLLQELLSATNPGH